MNQLKDQLSDHIPYEVIDQFTRQTELAMLLLNLHTSKILYANPVCQGFWNLGQKDGDKALNYIIQTIHKEDKGHVIEKINKFLKGGGARSTEFRINLSEGIVKWVCL